MREAGFPFEVRLKPVEEYYPEDMEKEEVPLYLSQLKAAAFKDELLEGEILITADTVVCLQGRILGKPNGREEAIRMLQALSGCCHTVVTGVCLTSCQWQHAFSVRTKVFFKVLTLDEIMYYVDTYKPFDKAGAYGIQEWIGYIGIGRIEGSFYNVMGLPVQRVYEALQRIEEY